MDRPTDQPTNNRPTTALLGHSLRLVANRKFWGTIDVGEMYSVRLYKETENGVK